MEAQTTFVRADRSIELDTIASVDLSFPVVIDPCDPELNDPLRFNHTFEKRSLLILGMFFNDRFERCQYFFNGLKKFRLCCILFFCCRNDSIYIITHGIYPLTFR